MYIHTRKKKYRIDGVATSATIEIPYGRWIMRTNNYSSRRNFTKSVALVVLLSVCFVFAFAMTYSLAQIGLGGETAYAAKTGHMGGTDLLPSTFTAKDMASAGFPGNDSGTTSWSYTEDFSSVAFSITAQGGNVSMNNSKEDDDADYTYSAGTGTFGWATQTGRYVACSQFAYVNYQVPQFLSDLIASSHVTVTVYCTASVSESDSNFSNFYGIKQSASIESASSASNVPSSDVYKNSSGNKITLTAGNNYIVFATCSSKGQTELFIGARKSTVSVSNIKFYFNVTMASSLPADNANTVIKDGASPVVASRWQTGITDQYQPYNTSTASPYVQSPTTTWPVWYDSIKSKLTSAIDSVSYGAGKMLSYTNTPLGQANGHNYYKKSVVEFVDSYDYSQSGGLGALNADNVEVSKKVMGLGDKLINTYNGSASNPNAAITWKDGDTNKRYASGIKKVEVGTITDTTGATFNVYDISIGQYSDYQQIIVSGEAVGYARVYRVSRVRVRVECYIYANANVKTTVYDYGSKSTATTIRFGGIDTTPPEQFGLDSDYVSTTVDGLGAVNWWRQSIFSVSTAYQTDNGAPSLWFYRVDKATINPSTGEITFPAARTYADYNALKDSNLQPFGSKSLMMFEYNFNTGKASGVADTVGNSLVNATGVGYYRFTFFALDFAGNFNATPTTYYVKTDYESPTFDVGFQSYEFIGDGDWQTDYYDGSYKVEKYNANPRWLKYGGSFYPIDKTTLCNNNKALLGSVSNYVPMITNLGLPENMRTFYVKIGEGEDDYVLLTVDKIYRPLTHRQVGDAEWKADYYEGKTFKVNKYNANPRWIKHEGVYVKVDASNLCDNSHNLLGAVPDYFKLMEDTSLPAANRTFYVKIDEDYVLLETSNLCKTIGVEKNNTWFNESVDMSVTLQNGKSLSGNTFTFYDADGVMYGIVFNRDYITHTIVDETITPTEAETSWVLFENFKTGLDKINVKIAYNSDGSKLTLTFPDMADANGQYPNIDWSTSFKMYAGVNYEADGSVFATDGWKGGIRFLLDKNDPETPTLHKAEDSDNYLKDGVNGYSMSIPEVGRKWFTDTGLLLNVKLSFNEALLDTYSSGIKVYIGVKKISNAADFTALNNFVKNGHYKSIEEADYATVLKRDYFDDYSYFDGSKLESGDDNEKSIRLLSTLGPGMRVIYVWSIDQAGNYSPTVQQYYVLADDYTYTIESAVVANTNLTSSAVTITQTNEEGDVVNTFKRGDVVTLALSMQSDNAPYKFYRVDGGDNVRETLLVNYSPAYAWETNVGFENFVLLDNARQRINLTVDANSVGLLDTVNSGLSTKKLIYRISRRQVITYTASYSARYNGGPVAVTMNTLDKATELNTFVFKYLNEDGTLVAGDGRAPTNPGVYKVAIYVPYDDANFVLDNNSNAYLPGTMGYYKDNSGIYQCVEGVFSEIAPGDLEGFEGQRYSQAEFFKFNSGAYVLKNGVFTLATNSDAGQRYAFVQEGPAYCADNSGIYQYAEGVFTIIPEGERAGFEGQKYSLIGATVKFYETASGEFKLDANGNYIKLGAENYNGKKYSALREESEHQLVAYNTFTILKGLVTISAKISSSIYGDAPVLDYTVSGLGDAVAGHTAIQNAGFELKLQTSETGTLNVGEYQIVVKTNATGASLENYEITYISAIHTIHKKTVKISIVGAVKYFGDDDPDAKFSVDLSEFISAEELLNFFQPGFGSPASVVGNVYTFIASDAIYRSNTLETVGIYEYSVDSTRFDVGQNYQLTVTNEGEATLVINKREVTLYVSGQSLVKKDSEGFNPAVDYELIVPTYTLAQNDAKIANLISGQLELGSEYVDLELADNTEDYKYRYQYTITIGNIANANINFTLSDDKAFIVYVVEGAVVIRLKDGASISAVYGEQWNSATSIPYSDEYFTGLPALDEGQEYVVEWSTVIAGHSDGDYLNVGSYLVRTVVTSVTVKEGENTVDTLSKVYVDSFNLTVTPAVIVVRPTRAVKSKAYGAADSVYGIGYSIVSIDGKTVGTEPGQITTFANMNIANDILTTISGSYARGLYLENGTLVSLGTRGDFAADANGVLYSDENKYYGYAVSKAFASSNLNFTVNSDLDETDAAVRFEITKKTIKVDPSMFVGISRKVDGTNVARYANDAQIADIMNQLVFSADDVKVWFTTAYYTSVDNGIADAEAGVKTITFTGLFLKGDKKWNYELIVVNGKDQPAENVTISYLVNDDPLNQTVIRIVTGSVTINQVDVSIEKQYDGTSTISINDVRIARNENNSMLVECLESGNATLQAGSFGGATAVSKYTINIDIAFKFDSPNDIDISEQADSNAVFEKKEDMIVLHLKNIINAQIVPKVIDSSSFESIEAVARDYNATDDVEVAFTLKDGVILEGEDPEITISATISDGSNGKGWHRISFSAFDIVGNDKDNYTVDIDEINTAYPQTEVKINPAQLIPNVKFEERDYDGTTSLVVASTRDKTAHAFTTLNYASDLSAELAKITMGGGVEYKLSKYGLANANVLVDADGNAIAHDVLVTNLSVSVSGELPLPSLDNYVIYGYNYDANEPNESLRYKKVTETPSNNVSAYELLSEVLISKKVINIKTNDITVHDKVYDGTRNATATIKVVGHEDIIDADEQYISITATGLFDQKYASESPINVSLNDVTLTVADSAKNYLMDNYLLSGASDVNIQKRIYARPVTFSVDLGSRTYNGEEAVSSNVISYTIGTKVYDGEGKLIEVKWGELEKEKNTYGIQTTGGAYFIDKNVEFVADANGKFKAEFVKSESGLYKNTGDEENPVYVKLTVAETSTYPANQRYALYYRALTETELTTYNKQRYGIGAKAGTVYNPVIKNTKSAYTNYVLTYTVDKSGYDGVTPFRAVALDDGTIYYAADPRLSDPAVEARITTYFFDLKEAAKYIYADNAALLETEKNNIVGFYKVGDRDAYLVLDSAGSCDGTLDAAVTYSNDAEGMIRQLAAVINHVEAKDGSTAFSKQFDGSTKFYGEVGTDFTFNDSSIGIADDDLRVEGIFAEFESAEVGSTYVSVRAERLGGLDANNYTYGVSRSERISATIEKRTITATLNDDTMVYGTNLSSVKGNVTYKLGGYDLEITDKGVMIKYTQFLKLVGLVANVGDNVSKDDLNYLKYLIGGKLSNGTEYASRLHLKAQDGTFGDSVEYEEANFANYYVRIGILGRTFIAPKAVAEFATSRPTAGTVAGNPSFEYTRYYLTGGESTNYDFDFIYTGTNYEGSPSSKLEVIKKDMYVVAAVKDYEKEYGADTPHVNLNYYDANGNEGRASGETVDSIFGENVPKYWFSLYTDAQSFDGSPILLTAKVNSDPSFAGDYVLVIQGVQGFVPTNYNVHYGTVERVEVAGGYEFKYSFDGTTFTATAPTLTIKMPTLSGVGMASKDGEEYTVTYNAKDQTEAVFAGGKAGDRYEFYNTSGNKVNVRDAGTYEGTFILVRKIDASYVDEQGNAIEDNNGYEFRWSTKTDGGQESVKLVINKASSGLSAPDDSVRYDGKAHEYNIAKITISDELRSDPDYFSATYKKKVEGNYEPVTEMKDAGVYEVTLNYDPHDDNYESGKKIVYFSIIKASVVVAITYTERQLYEDGKGYEVNYSITSVAPSKDAEQRPLNLLSEDDLMVQFLVNGKSMFTYNDGKISSVDSKVVKMVNGKFVFGNSGRYPFQIVLKDASLKDNFDITQTEIISGKETSTTATGTLQLVVTSIGVKTSKIEATLDVKQTEGEAKKTLLADGFEARYVTKNNQSSAEDDAYYAAIDSAFMPAIEAELNTSVTISAIIRMNLTLGGQRINLDEGMTTTVSVELSPEILDSLDSTIIYRTAFNSNGTTRLEKLENYTITEDGMLVYDTDSLGSIVFVKAGRETPMLAVWTGAGIAGGIVLVVAVTGLYIGLKKRRLKKEILD